MDLATFQLGPISFGRITLVPERGVKAFTGGVDLRPDLDLLVTVSAGIDNATVIVTWRFTSIDPGTGRPYRLVTSDRGLRGRAGGAAEDVVGGGTFARMLRAL